MSFFYIRDDVAREGPQYDEDVVVLVAGGELDYNATPQLRKHIIDHILAGKRRLVLDLSKVTFLDSTAVGVLIGALVRLQEGSGGSVTIVCAEDNRKVLRIFEITGIENLIDLHHTREEALLALAVAS